MYVGVKQLESLLKWVFFQMGVLISRNLSKMDCSAKDRIFPFKGGGGKFQGAPAPICTVILPVLGGLRTI